MKKREEGRGVGEAKKDLDDLQRQTWIQERKKAKEEEKAAREAVRLYIDTVYPELSHVENICELAKRRNLSRVVM